VLRSESTLQSRLAVFIRRHSFTFFSEKEQWKMAKKFLFVTVLLLLVGVQALTASCDLRCSLIGSSIGSHALHDEVPMAHCYGMTMERSKDASFTSHDSCAHSGCETEFKAINKGTEQDKADATKLLVSAVALIADPLGASGPNRTTALASLSRRSESRPLAQRPGSSLRI
jgi:hypothetical protein